MTAEATRESSLIQLHWQERMPPHRTEFVGQYGPINSYEDMEAALRWVNELIGRRQGECPEDWTPMICTQDAPEFVWAAINPAETRLTA